MSRNVGDVKWVPRKERAARTRRGIVAAATEEFRANGYHGTTMAAIAGRAGVAVQTVYFVFHTKPALLTAAIDAAVMGEDDPVPPEATVWWRECTTTPDGRRALEVFVAQTARISTRAAALDRVALAAATTDPEVGDVIAHHERLRESGFRAYAVTLADRRLLKPGLDAAEVTDVLLTMCGSEVFLGFTGDRGWDVERYAKWTADALGTLLLGA